MWITLLTVAGCGLLPFQPGVDANGGFNEAAITPVGPQRPQARPDRNAPVREPDVSVGTIGRTVASLGNPAEPGLWLKTPLVDSRRQARVHSATSGKSVSVTLIPIDGPRTAGSRMSLAAMQALGVSPADLVEVDVFGT